MNKGKRGKREKSKKRKHLPIKLKVESSEKRLKKIRKDKEKSKKREYQKTLVSGFDDLFKEGIPAHSSILVEGGPGTGKTIFCLQVAFNTCKQGKKALYMSFEEPEERLRQHMRGFGWNPEEYEKKGLLKIKRFSALDIARSVEALLSEAKRELLIDIEPVLFPHDFEPDVVLVDSLSAIASAFSGEESRFRIYMEQLFRYLEDRQITSYLIRETSNPTHVGGTGYIEKYEAVSFLSDGIICLYNVFFKTGVRGRAIEILKMRGTSFKRAIVLMDVDTKGIVVYPHREIKGNYELT